MRLLQVKLRGLGSLPVTDWLPLHTAITVLRCKDTQAGRQILRAVQSLNPPYDCLTEQPFSTLPKEEVLANGSHRIIAPDKRTIVIGIFDTPSFLVKELGAITTPLYETDRVEVGRRLDYSRWLNFVEIASSSRWSEVSTDLHKLSHEYPDASGTQNIRRLLAEAVPSDRIKGEMAEELAGWVTLLQQNQPETKIPPDLLEKILRADKFSEARALVYRRLPLFLTVNSDEVPQLAELKTDENKPPINPLILIDCFNSAHPEQRKTAVPKEIAALAQQYQCLCFTDGLHAGWDLPAAQLVEVEAPS